MLYALFAAELALLFYLSQQITTLLSRLFFHIFKSQTVVIQLLSLLFLPGVVVHELGHLLVANVLLVPTGEVEFFPEVHGNEVKMGSVAIASTDPLRRFLIGVAPLLVGLCMLFISFWYLHGVPFMSWQTTLLLYIVFEVSNTMFSSRKDMEGAIGFLAVILLFAAVSFFLGIRVPTSGLDFLNGHVMQEVLVEMNGYVFIGIAIDVVILLMGNIFLKAIRK